MKENPEIKNVVIYARYSDNKQTENSIEGQLEVCKAFCERKGYHLIGQYIDRAQSGRSDQRKAFQKMLADSKKGGFDAVVVYALDRFGRSMLQMLLNEKALEENNVALLSATEETKNDASGRMQRGMHMVFAEYYSAELAQKVRRGAKVKAEQALYLGGPLPLGYAVDEKKRYVIDDMQASIVREIFQKYANGWTYTDLCKDFNNRQIKTSNGNAFNKNSFHVILNNRRYLGIYIYKNIEIPGAIPQIIDEKLFNEVAAKMKLNKKAPGRNRAKAEYLLTQKMYCGYCGEMMIGHSSNQVSTKGVIYNYYRCKDAGGNRPCQKKMIPKDFIEDTVIRECLKLLTPESIQRITKEVLRLAKSDEATAGLRYFEKAIKTKEREITNQKENLRKCTSDAMRDLIFEDLRELMEEKEELERQYTLEKAKCFIVSEEDIVARLTKLAEGDVQDKVYRRSLIRIFVNKIMLFDKKMTIIFNTGDESVEITSEILDKIQQGLGDEALCFSDVAGHHEIIPMLLHRDFSIPPSRKTRGY